MDKRTLRRSGKAVAPISAAVVLSLASMGQVQAQQDIAGDWEHFVDCFGWMITDPPTQYENCGPFTVPVVFDSLSTQADGNGGEVIPDDPEPS